MARSPATIRVTCDRCQISVLEIELLPTSYGWDDGIIGHYLRKALWESIEDEDICGECANRNGLMAVNN